MKNTKENNFYDFFDRQSEETYEGSHSARLDFLVEDLTLVFLPTWQSTYDENVRWF